MVFLFRSDLQKSNKNFEGKKKVGAKNMEKNKCS